MDLGDTIQPQAAGMEEPLSEQILSKDLLT